MNSTNIQTLILSTLSDYGFYVLGILSAVIGIGVAYLIYYYGWRAIKNSVMGSMGEAFNIHGESKKYDEDGFAEDGSYRDPLIAAMYEGEKIVPSKHRKNVPF